MSHAVAAKLVTASAIPNNAQVGLPTTASGDEAEPTWSIKTVTMAGTVITSMTVAEPDTVTWTLNAPDECTFHFPKGSYSRADLTAIGNSTHAIEVQVYRNNDLVFWGPITSVKGSGKDGTVSVTCDGVDWYLNRRFVDGTITNLLSNPDFESGTTGWTTSGGSLTFTASTDNFVTGSHSAKLQSVSAPTVDHSIGQTVVTTPNGVGLLLTLSGWFYIDQFTSPPFGFRGLYMEGIASGGTVVSNNYWPIDSASPVGTWTKATTTLWVPPNQSWTINVRLYPITGTIYYDDIKLVAMESLSTAGITGSVKTPVDLSAIIKLLIIHAQDGTYGKSSVNLGYHTETVGVTLAKTWQFVDHVQFDQALKEFTERGDGCDFCVDLTPTSRTFHSFAGKRGTDRTGSVTLRYDPANPSTSNCADYRYSQDSGAAITRSTVIGSDNGPAREQGEAVDASQLGGVILQEVFQAPQDALPASLQPLANEHVTRFSVVPETIEMDLLGKSGLIPTLKPGDLVHVVVNDGWNQVDADRRIMKLQLNAATNVMTVYLAIDTL